VSTLIHLSDLHFGRVNADVAKAVLTEIREREPSLTVISGDFTQRARRREYRRARAFLRRIESPTLCVPGNHDIPDVNLVERFLAPLRRYRHYIGREKYPTHQDREISAIGLNTARSYGFTLDWSQGRINAAQVHRVEKHFAEVPERQVRIVVTHHPFLPPPDGSDQRTLRHARKTLGRFARAGVDLVLAGHLHKAYTGEAGKAFPDISRSFVVAQTSTSTSTRLKDEPNAFNWIEAEPGAITIRSYAWNGSAFAEQAVASFRTEGDGWIRTDGPEAARVGTAR
jgi:3',5'-cyclic AMP phosphodiesterase CpdA